MMRYLAMPALHQIEAQDMTTLNEVVAWAKEASKSDDRIDVLMAIRWLEGRLGAPRIGRSRLDHIYQWIRLDQVEHRANKEKKLYER